MTSLTNAAFVGRRSADGGEFVERGDVRLAIDRESLQTASEVSLARDQHLYGFGQVFLEQEPVAPGVAAVRAASRLRFSFDPYTPASACG